MEDGKESPMNKMNSRDDLLRRVQTADSVFLPREVFEALYLNPERNVPNDLRKRLGNPTPAALIGFVMAATPYACANMGWRGAGGLGGALIPVMIFFGGILQIVGAIMEWILGNTFSMCLFFTYGTFWLVAGTQLVPAFGVGIHYSATGDSLAGMSESAYYATFGISTHCQGISSRQGSNEETGFYYLTLAMVTTVFTVCSLRTNIVFFSALFTLIFAFACAAGAFWNLALGNVHAGERLTVAAGAFTFALTMMVWYLLIVQLLESVDFPITLPVGDLSQRIKGKKERLARKEGVNVAEPEQLR
ncbi:hypothetical protein LTR10_023413 [Elasticomyces elasticus]|uniref:GPR1/FUN34/YaaH-class plasma membrane protein n=1 Tax=Exophiala sideris TaxID=1016849 RepID=A0ABR0JJW6_9EURO|nr:hypothetical protein LTR10_023413 [Elasticomyces elasticus]KAK5035308.1 hypothetical protein LTS07_002744 [Exophiala sideris]KAK5039341.1 hypothetical protein LTR13_003598 [Exophiala sideris]KAK5066232.1 hypothetical protein LTR69_002750 [Exophiala sideris]KAK5186909.1 hypothetical protein LTR44_000915 [Eurotiomycetes sp. CCFEE 6388]